MASAAIRRGVLFYAETWIRYIRVYALSLGLVAVVQPLLYLVAMGVGLGALVRGDVAGVSYLRFVAPAIMVSTMTAAAMGEFSYNITGGFLWNKGFFAPNQTPIQPRQIAGGVIVACCLRFTIQCLIFWAMMVAFGAVDSALSLLSVPISLLCALAFGLPLMAYTAQMKREHGQLNLVQRFIVMPLSLFSGTYFLLETMPGYLQWIGWVSPIWHATQLARVVCFGLVEPGWLIVTHVAYLVALALLGWVLAMRFFERRLRD
jgi:lipooligosaccharide transport system permease protein